MMNDAALAQASAERAACADGLFEDDAPPRNVKRPGQPARRRPDAWGADWQAWATHQSPDGVAADGWYYWRSVRYPLRGWAHGALMRIPGRPADAPADWVWHVYAGATDDDARNVWHGRGGGGDLMAESLPTGIRIAGYARGYGLEDGRDA